MANSRKSRQGKDICSIIYISLTSWFARHLEGHRPRLHLLLPLRAGELGRQHEALLVVLGLQDELLVFLHLGQIKAGEMQNLNEM